MLRLRNLTRETEKPTSSDFAGRQPAVLLNPITKSAIYTVRRAGGPGDVFLSVVLVDGGSSRWKERPIHNGQEAERDRWTGDICNRSMVAIGSGVTGWASSEGVHHQSSLNEEEPPIKS